MGRKLPDADMGSASSSTKQIANKRNNINSKIVGYQYNKEHISTIEAGQTLKENNDLSNRYALQNNYHLLDFENLSTSNESLYSPIDNLSELEEALDDNGSNEKSNLCKKKSDSCENFVVKWQLNDLQFYQALNYKKNNKSIVLNVMNMVWPIHFLNDEKSYY